MAVIQHSEFKGNPFLVLRRNPEDRYPFQFSLRNAKLIVEAYETGKINDWIKRAEIKLGKKADKYKDRKVVKLKDMKEPGADGGSGGGVRAGVEKGWIVASGFYSEIAKYFGLDLRKLENDNGTINVYCLFDKQERYVFSSEKHSSIYGFLKGMWYSHTGGRNLDRSTFEIWKRRNR